jgi:hypothetical protein
MTHLGLDEGGEGEEVEEIGEVAPHVRVAVFAQTLVVEAVNLRDLSTFVVPSEDGDPVAVAQLHGHEQGDRLDGVVATVDVVTHKEIVGIWRVATNAEELRKIVLRVVRRAHLPSEV